MALNVGTLLGVLKLDTKEWDTTLTKSKNDLVDVGKKISDMGKTKIDTNNLKAMNREIKSLEGVAAELRAKLVNVIPGSEKAKQYQQELAKIEDRMDLLRRTAEDTRARLNAFGDKLIGIGSKMTLGITTPIMAIGAASAKMAGDYEQSMNMFQAVSSATAEQMKNIDKLAVDLGNDLTLPATSANDATQAMLELNKAGLSVADTMDAAKGVLQMSAAAEIDNARAAEITANSLNMFGLSGNEAVRVADILAASANAASGEITDMAESLQMGGSVAKMAGVDIDEFMTAVSLMANQGVKGSDAGTSLKQMIMSLLNPSNKAAKVMERFGINVYDAQGKMLPMRALIEQFSSKLGGLSEQERNWALATIFGSDAVRAANIVMMKGTSAYDDMHKAVTKEGAAADVAGAKMKGLNGAIQGLQSGWETFSLKLGQSEKGPLTMMIRAAGKLMSAMGNLPSGVVSVIAVLGGLAAAAGPAIVVIGTVAKSIPDCVGAFATLGKAGKSVVGFLPKLGSAFTSLAGVMKVAWAAMISPAGLWAIAIIAAVALVAGAVYLIIKNWDKIKGFFINLWNGIKSLFKGVYDWFVKWGFTVSPALWLLVHWKDLPRWFSQIWEGVKGGFKAAWNWIKNLILNYTPQGLIIKHWRQIVPFFQSMGKQVVNAMKNMYNGVKTWLVDKFAGIAKRVKAPIEAIKKFFAGLYDAVVGHSYVPDMVRDVQAWMNKLAHDAMVNPAKRAKNKTVQAFHETAQEVKGILSDLNRSLAANKEKKSLFGDLFDLDSENAGGIRSAIDNLFSKGIKARDPLIQKLFGQLQDAEAPGKAREQAAADAAAERERADAAAARAAGVQSANRQAQLDLMRANGDAKGIIEAEFSDRLLALFAQGVSPLLAMILAGKERQGKLDDIDRGNTDKEAAYKDQQDAAKRTRLDLMDSLRLTFVKLTQGQLAADIAGIEAEADKKIAEAKATISNMDDLLPAIDIINADTAAQIAVRADEERRKGQEQAPQAKIGTTDAVSAWQNMATAGFAFGRSDNRDQGDRQREDMIRRLDAVQRLLENGNRDRTQGNERVTRTLAGVPA